MGLDCVESISMSRYLKGDAKMFVLGASLFGVGDNLISASYVVGNIVGVGVGVNGLGLGVASFKENAPPLD